MHRHPIIHHRVRKLKYSTTCEPPAGPATWATDHAMVYNPAYCPRLFGLVLDTQKEFINGMDDISAMVTKNVNSTAEMPSGGKIFSNKKEIPINKVPLLM